jgi:3-methylfumaryl-CoA hydratase
MAFESPLVLDAPAELSLSVAEIRHRSGKTGDLVFVEIDRRLSQDGVACLTERQTVVYRGLGATVPTVEPTAPPRRHDVEVWDPGPVDLFRFSAVTFNAHRIHYDLSYATGEEGYPGLVVHGPFTAAKLFALARARAGKPLKSFSFRAVAPLFAGQPVYLGPGEADGDVQAQRCDGIVAMTAHAET